MKAGSKVLIWAPLAGKKNGALFEEPALMTRFELLLSEVIVVAKASGSDIDPAGTLQAEILASVGATAENQKIVTQIRP